MKLAVDRDSAFETDAHTAESGAGFTRDGATASMTGERNGDGDVGAHRHVDCFAVHRESELLRHGRVRERRAQADTALKEQQAFFP